MKNIAKPHKHTNKLKQTPPLILTRKHSIKQIQTQIIYKHKHKFHKLNKHKLNNKQKTNIPLYVLMVGCGGSRGPASALWVGQRQGRTVVGRVLHNTNKN